MDKKVSHFCWTKLLNSIKNLFNHYQKQNNSFVTWPFRLGSNEKCNDIDIWHSLSSHSYSWKFCTFYLRLKKFVFTIKYLQVLVSLVNLCLPNCSIQCRSAMIAQFLALKWAWIELSTVFPSFWIRWEELAAEQVTLSFFRDSIYHNHYKCLCKKPGGVL